MTIRVLRQLRDEARNRMNEAWERRDYEAARRASTDAFHLSRALERLERTA